MKQLYPTASLSKSTKLIAIFSEGRTIQCKSLSAEAFQETIYNFFMLWVQSMKIQWKYKLLFMAVEVINSAPHMGQNSKVLILLPLLSNHSQNKIPIKICLGLLRQLQDYGFKKIINRGEDSQKPIKAIFRGAKKIIFVSKDRPIVYHLTFIHAIWLGCCREPNL